MLLVDDEPAFLDAVEALIERAGGLEVVARAANGEEALRRAAELMPDVITMDLDMPVMDGLDATRMISAYFNLPIAVVTGSDVTEQVEQALAAGAAAHVVKSKAGDALVPTLRTAARRSQRH